MDQIILERYCLVRNAFSLTIAIMGTAAITIAGGTVKPAGVACNPA